MAVQYASPSDEVALFPRLSVGAFFSGGVLALAVTTVLYLLGMGIVLLTTDVGSFGGALIALGVILIVTTIAGGAIGGFVAGGASGSGVRRAGGLHGLLSSAVAFLVATFFCMLIVWKLLGAAGSAVATTAQTAAQATSTAAGAAQGGNLAGNSEHLLQSLGYSAVESRQMVSEAQRSVQHLLRGGGVPSGAQVQQQAASAGDSLLHYFGGAIGIYFGTWFLAMLAALGGGIFGARRVHVGVPDPNRREILPTLREREPSPHPSPLITPPFPTGA